MIFISYIVRFTLWSSFVSPIGRTMYVTVVRLQSLNWNVKKNSVSTKKKHHTMENAWTIFIHELRCIKNSLVLRAPSFVFSMHRNSWIKIIRAHFPWNNLYINCIYSIWRYFNARVFFREQLCREENVWESERRWKLLLSLEETADYVQGQI